MLPVMDVGDSLSSHAGWSCDPRAGHPLGVDVELVDSLQQLLIGAVKVIVAHDHVEVLDVILLHLTRLLNDVLQLVVLNTKLRSQPQDR